MHYVLGVEERENNTHVFRQCPVTVEVWQILNLSWVINSTMQSFLEWITRVFNKSTYEQCRMFCCGLWFIWNSRNKLIHERKSETRSELSQKVQRYIAELEGLMERTSTLNIDRSHSQREANASVTIQFDAAFDKGNFKLASGLMV